VSVNTSTQSPDAALVSWSGGKDSCLALWRAQQQGVKVRRLLSALDETGQRARSHGVSPALLRSQAQALGLESQFIAATWHNYEAQFVEALQEARASGITQAVFGDIDLQAHRDWEEKVCANAGITPLLPLWLGHRLDLVHEFWAAGFKAVVVCVDGRFLDASYAGRLFDEAFVASLPEGVDACGENGEFHTFVYDGPGFKQPVAWHSTGSRSYTSPAEFGSVTYHFGLIEAI
jgi:uncharacterized protein (TIGR00290 family)